MISTEISAFRALALAGLVAGFAAGTAPAGAAEGYAADSDASLVRSGSGECVRTGSWDADMNIPECDPALAARLEQERLEAERLAAEAAAAAAAAAAIQPAAARMIRVSDEGEVAFAFDSADLTDAAVSELQRVAEEVQGYSSVERIEITGYTDSSGPEAYNQKLSERRAESVSEVLTQAGLPADRMSVKGMGEANPIADNGTREGRARNRRVDVRIIGERAE
jgi:OOP family OmpA-OmpF porin